jgi:hypothetical protein
MLHLRQEKERKERRRRRGVYDEGRKDPLPYLSLFLFKSS